MRKSVAAAQGGASIRAKRPHSPLPREHPHLESRRALLVSRIASFCRAEGYLAIHWDLGGIAWLCAYVGTI